MDKIFFLLCVGIVLGTLPEKKMSNYHTAAFFFSKKKNPQFFPSDKSGKLIKFFFFWPRENCSLFYANLEGGKRTPNCSSLFSLFF